MVLEKINEKREETRNTVFRNIKKSPLANTVVCILNNFSCVCSYDHKEKNIIKILNFALKDSCIKCKCPTPLL